MVRATATALVLGAGGFVGGHLVARLKREGVWVRGVDVRAAGDGPAAADEFVVADLREPSACRKVIDRPFDEVYQFAADMGGAGYLFTGEHDADVMHGSATINLNVLDACRRAAVPSVFFPSTACVYPGENQRVTDRPNCAEVTAYPARPDSEYGWEKLFAERVYLAFNRNYGMRNRIARYHTVFGPFCAWRGGREKALAALCRKVAEAAPGGAIEIWGDGEQTRTFLYIDECLEGTLRLMRSDFEGPVNIGSDEMISINQLVDLIMEIAGKPLEKRHVSGPLGVRGRTSDNRLIRERLDWAPSAPLRQGLVETYRWIANQVAQHQAAAATHPA